MGRLGEDLALAHLRRLGFELIDRNYRVRNGEIDLIVHNADVLLFVEVKTRVLRHGARGGPAASAPLDGIRTRQRLRLRRLVAGWLAANRRRPTTRDIRADAIGVLLDSQLRLLRLDHVEGVI